MYKILVLGGTGFIGTEICNTLSQLGNSVTAADNFSRNKQLENLSPSVNIEQCDVLNSSDVVRLVNCSDAVINLAFINGTHNFYNRPRDVMTVAFEGQYNVLSAINNSDNVQRFVYASSSEVYQQPDIIPTPEDIPLIVPDINNNRYSYGGGKIIGELTTKHYLKPDVDWQIFRPHNIYGPRMGNEHVVPQLITRINQITSESGSVIDVQGGGSSTRSFCYITDFGLAFDALWRKGLPSTIYNIGTELEVSISTIVEILLSCAGSSLSINSVPSPEGGTSRRCPDTSKIRDLGFNAKVDLQQGLKLSYEWYTAQNSHGGTMP